MKALRRIGCWTALVLLVAAGTLVFLFNSSRQERSDFSGRPIRGNVVILGGDVEISSDEYVRGNLLVVGDDLTLEGQIGGNLVVIGGDADLTGHAQVGGNVSVVGGDAEAGGSSVVGGNVAVVGGDVELAGHSRVGGNVRVVGGRIERGPDAHVAGNSSWRVYTNSVAHPDLYSAAPEPLALTDPPRQPDPAVSVVVETGGPEERGQSQRRQRAVEELAEAAEEAAEELAEAAEAAAEAAEAAAEEAAKAAREQSEMQREAALEAGAAARAQAAANRTPWFLVFLGKLVRAFLWTLLITALVLLFAWLLPKQVKAISETAEKETALSFAAGAIGIMGAALLAAILTITVCFALLALPILALLRARSSVRLDCNLLLVRPPARRACCRSWQCLLESADFSRAQLPGRHRGGSLCLGNLSLSGIHFRPADWLNRYGRGNSACSSRLRSPSKGRAGRRPRGSSAWGGGGGSGCNQLVWLDGGIFRIA